MPFENRNYAFAGAFVDELARCGLRHVCICPGSRSSPLAISFARQGHIKTWMHLDERSAAFFALGMAKYLREPVALVCSSGTATANFFPAIVEAHYSAVPLLVLTADRPPELLDWGALQTIDQTRMYGSHVKWAVNMPPPEATPALMAFVRSMAGRAFATAAGMRPGPVHLNFPFREPLEPVNVSADFPAGPVDESCVYGRSDRPFLRAVTTDRSVSSGEMPRLAAELAATERGVIICGPLAGEGLAESVAALAQRLGYPVLADCLSQVRCGRHDHSMVIDGYDAFIGVAEVAASLAPEVIIRFGAVPVSKPLTAYLERHRQCRHILVDEGASWRDPFHLTGESWQADPALFCAELTSAIKGQPGPGRWQRRWRDLAETTCKAMSLEMSRFSQMFEGRIFTELARLLPEGSLLFAGNSMPVRDMDTFFPAVDKPLRFMANRGASGIDGVVSTALGASAVSSGRVTLVLGDISFYHDMNGLLAAKAFGLNATIIVINNNGGGIFSFLPQAEYEDVFETYFATPHGLSFDAAARLYGIDYCLADSWSAFDTAVEQSLTGTGTTIIEVPGDRKLNARRHREIRGAVAASISKLREVKSGTDSA
ncbi:MAG: 2-succinyl-5-enolpyruvyl-6-hydroxy-3-cyclohexene-1-carboxylic-acid synthase [Chloroflexi bacterium]|nr:2-succinyl-5-enolpyruvyl-6-hydroxy-3-cyclohexene-1-carboxylic-acid synthase [Chloroflexota bacterium]